MYLAFFFFSLIWFPVLQSYGMTSTLMEFTAVKFHASNMTTVFTQYLHAEIFRLYNIIYLSLCLPMEFVILFWKNFFLISTRKYKWRCGEMQYTGLSNYDAENMTVKACMPRRVQRSWQAYATSCNESLYKTYSSCTVTLRNLCPLNIRSLSSNVIYLNINCKEFSIVLI